MNNRAFPDSFFKGDATRSLIILPKAQFQTKLSAKWQYKRL
ncbi:hypothetical protein [Bartonella sp. M0283]|nr:hypothetical protein [Bartonella sp. M0283]